MLQVRSGNIIDLDGRLCQILKLVHTQGHGRQLGNVQVRRADTFCNTCSISSFFVHADAFLTCGLLPMHLHHCCVTACTAMVQIELRDLHAQTKLYERRRPSDMVELVRLEGRQYQYLYSNAGYALP